MVMTPSAYRQTYADNSTSAGTHHKMGGFKNLMLNEKLGEFSISTPKSLEEGLAYENEYQKFSIRE